MNRQLVIEDVSNDLLLLINYSQKEELLQKHVSTVLPRYFYFLQNGEFNIDRKWVVLKMKTGQYVLAKAYSRMNSTGFRVKFKIVKNKNLNQFIYNELHLFEHIQNVENVGMVCFNMQGDIVLVNKYIEQWYGLPNSCIGSKMDQLLKISEEESRVFYTELNEINDNSLRKEFVVQTSNNNKCIFRWEISKMQLPNGTYFISRVYNITSKYKIKKELNYQQMLFQKVFELSPLPIFIFNKNYRVEKVNNAFLELLEVDRTLAENLDLTVLIDKRPFYVYTDVLEHKKMSLFEGYYNTTYSQKSIYARLIASPVEVDGEAKGLGIILDLTKLKKTEEELTQKQNFYKTMIEVAITGIGITDLDENLIFVNKAFANMLGYEEKEIVNTNLRNYSTPQQYELFKKQTEIRKSRKNSIYEITLIHKNGRPVNFILFSSPYLDANNKVIGTLGVLVDVSYQKMLLQLYEKLKLEYQTLENEKQTIINTIWKRFNLFLPTLIELLKIDKTSMTPHQLLEIESHIQRNNEMLSITYKDMDLLVKLFSQKYKIKQNKVSLMQMFNNIVNNFYSGGLDQYCSFEWQSDTDDILVEIDEGTIAIIAEKIIYNFIFRNYAQKILIKAFISNNQLLLSFCLYHENMAEPSKIINFNEHHLCYLIVKKLLQLVKGNIYIADTSIDISIPFKRAQVLSLSEEAEITENIYSTYIWSNKIILYITDNNLLNQWIYDVLAPTKAQLYSVNYDTQFVYYILKYPYADIVLISSSVLDNDEIDYIGLIRRLVSGAKIICLLEPLSNEKKYNGIDDFLTITDKFAIDLVKTMSKFM